MNHWRITLYFLLTLTIQQTYAQGQWAWMHGPSQFCGDTGVYHIMGMADSTSYPAPRKSSAEWVDKQGNFWIYSGYPRLDGNTPCGTDCGMCDMWKFNPSTLLWTWISGPDSITYQQPVYGSSKGVFSSVNTPGIRISSSTWTDEDGNFWLAGGEVIKGYGSPDVWKYDLSLGQWAWMGGQQANTSYSYTCFGNFTPGNSPGGLCQTSDVWRVGNRAYMFGGWVRNTYGSQPHYSDELWVYDMSLNQWACVSYNLSAFPDGRACSTGWLDEKKRFWLYGGRAGNANNVIYSDLWYFNLDSLQWTMVSDNVQNITSICGNDPSSFPGKQWCGSTAYTDSCNRFWLYGGMPDNQKTRDDLWLYNPKSNLWNLMVGTGLDTLGVYGSYRTFSSANIPLSRSASVGFISKDGVWVFSGFTFRKCGNLASNMLSDLWLYKPESISASFTFTDSAVGYYTFTGSAIVSCSNEASKYLWDFDDPASGAANTAQGKNVNHHFAADGQHNITMYAMDCFGHYDTVMYTISFRDTAGTGVNNEADSAPRISLFPNPAGKELNVSLTNLSGNNYLRIVNSLGQTVLSLQNLYEGPQAINIASLSPGVYYLELHDEEMHWRIKRSFLKY